VLTRHGRPAYLLLLARRLAWIGVEYEIKALGETLPKPHISRVQMLAEVRNRAMHTLYTSKEGKFSHVIFINDVAFCSKDVLELLHQHTWQEADMTCGFDTFTWATLFQKS
jgi:alpha-1,3-mannosyltransferase